MIRCTSLASRAIALKTLFERRARVCLKSNPEAAQPDKKINRLSEQADKPALDMENLPCANGCSELLEPNLAVGSLLR